MTIRNRAIVAVLGLMILAATAVPASAAQLGAGLHYLRTLDDFGGADNVSQNDFSIFGTVTFPFVLVQVEGNLEWVPDYLGSNENLFQPAVYGKLPLGLVYGSVGMGFGYLTGGEGWSANPFYALRAGVEFGLAGLSLDAFASYRFQSGNAWSLNDFTAGAQDFNFDALTLAAQIKFGS